MGDKARIMAEEAKAKVRARAHAPTPATRDRPAAAARLLTHHLRPLSLHLTSAQMASGADTAAPKASNPTEAAKKKTGYAGAHAGDKATEGRARAEADLAGAKQVE